jgi:ribosomal protein L22
VSEERQRIVRRAGSEPAEAEEHEHAAKAKQELGKEQARELADAGHAREEQDKPKRGRRRRKRADAEPRADQEAGDPSAEAEVAEDAEAGAPVAESGEEKGTRRRRRGRAAKADAEEAKQEEAEEEAEAEAAEAAPDEEPPPEDEAARPKLRRGSEVAAGREGRPAARRSPDGAVMVRARARYVRTAPRKARLVIDHIRGKSVDDARAILIHTPRAASRDVLKLLDSAVANAENNHELVADELKIGRVYVDEGPTIKRYRPRALGRATRIRKRTSHMTIELVPLDQG